MKLTVEHLVEMAPWEWPADAAGTILQTLTERRGTEEQRAIAAGLAGDLTVLDEKLAAALLKSLQDPSEPESVRANAAIACGPVLEAGDMEMVDGIFDDPEMIPVSADTYLRIRKAVHDVYADEATPKLVRRRALEAAVRAEDTWQTDEIRKAYASGDREWQLTAVFAMNYVEGFDSEIVEALKSSDEDIFFHAIQAAGSHAVGDAWPTIAKVLDSTTTDKVLLLTAIQAAGNFPLDTTRDALLPLTDSEDEEVAEAASEAMSMAEEAYAEDDEFDLDDEDDEEE
ncbi:MAG TPA: hypothetical protein VN736_26875 [Candidatus Limnocylindrales bacterium]|nr:hypothetical protein [Candidatus Limnocylindrales bacterium]